MDATLQLQYSDNTTLEYKNTAAGTDTLQASI